MRAFMRGLDAEPEFRELVLRGLNTLDDFTLTELLHGLAMQGNIPWATIAAGGDGMSANER